MKIETIATTSRFCKAKATSRSIIEEYSALHDHAVTNLESAPNYGLSASFEAGFHRNRFEGPGRDLGEHPIGVVLEHQSRCRNGRQELLWPEEHHIGKHAGLKSQGGVLDADADLGTTRVEVEHIADKEDLALEDLTRIGSEHDIGRLPFRDQGCILLRNVGGDPDRAEICNRHQRRRRIVPESTGSNRELDHAPR